MERAGASGVASAGCYRRGAQELATSRAKFQESGWDKVGSRRTRVNKLRTGEVWEFKVDRLEPGSGARVKGAGCEKEMDAGLMGRGNKRRGSPSVKGLCGVPHLSYKGVDLSQLCSLTSLQPHMCSSRHFLCS